MLTMVMVCDEVHVHLYDRMVQTLFPREGQQTASQHQNLNSQNRTNLPEMFFLAKTAVGFRILT